MTEQILIGLVTTLLATIIAVAWKDFIVPFFIETFGERIKLHKYWTADLDFGSGKLHGVKLEIKKLGYNISGGLEFTSGRHLGKKYYIKGRFQSSILSFHYYPYDKHSTSQGSATFMRLNDGELLKGYFVYFSQEGNSVDTVNCEFAPIKN